ncbi:armadillo-type protein [Zopfochytrium polystomum]|nr:armadillo-type protein [Zopfochytrium polystomum]
MTLLVPSFASPEPGSDSVRVQYEKIIKLFSGRHTSTMYERQAAVLDKLAKILEAGLPFKEVEHVRSILECALAKYEGGGALLKPALTRLLQCTRNLVPESGPKPSNFDAEVIVGLADTVSKFCLLNDPDLAIPAVEAIHSLGKPVETPPLTNRTINFRNQAQPAVTEPSDSEYKERKIVWNFLEQVEKSHAISNLVSSLRKKPEMPARLAIVQTLRHYSSERACEAIVSSGAIPLLMELMRELEDVSALRIIAELIRNVLSSSAKAKVTEEISDQDLQNFTTAFSRLNRGNMFTNEKHLRNELAIILVNVTEDSTRVCRMLCDLGVTQYVSELLISPRAAQPGQHADVDVKFRKLLFHLSSAICTDEKNLKLLLQNGILQYLLQLISSSTDPVQKWSESQILGFQQQAVNFLNTIISRVSSQWAASGGNRLLHDTLNRIISLPRPVGEIPRFRVDHSNFISGMLRLLFSISELGPSHKKALGAQGFFDSLLRIIRDEFCRTDHWRTAFLICSSLCQGCKQNKSLFGDAGGVEALMRFLKFESPDLAEKEAVILASIECVWGAVCGNRNNEKRFFQENGIFYLLNLLERSTYVVQRHIMGCLLDILENPKARSHILEWRSSTCETKGAAHLLVKLWLLEENRLGVTQGPSGSLMSDLKPLRGAHQHVSSKYVDSHVIDEISGNLRAKIYSTFCKLGFDHFKEELTLSERVKLALISKYLDFKIGEVWDEISDELDYEGVRPVSPDLDCILTAKLVVREKAKAVQLKQQEIRSHLNLKVPVS